MRFANEHGFFTISPLPNQPSVAVCYDFTIYKKYRGKGLAHGLKRYQSTVLKAQGYSMAMCTVQAANFAQQSVLGFANWTYIASFKDIRTGDLVQLWTYSIDQDH